MANPYHKTHKIFIPVGEKSQRIDVAISYFRVYETNAPVVICDSTGGYYEVDRACGFDLGTTAEWIEIFRDDQFGQFAGEPIRMRIQAGNGGRFVDGRLLTSAQPYPPLTVKIDELKALQELSDVIKKLNLPVRTRIIPNISVGKERPSTPGIFDIGMGNNVQVALDDTAAIRRRIRLSPAGAYKPAKVVAFVRLGSKDGVIIRRLVFGGECTTTTPWGSPNLDPIARDGYAQIEGCDALFVEVPNGQIPGEDGRPIGLSIMVEEEYRGETVKPVTVFNSLNDQKFPTSPAPAGLNFQPLITAISESAAANAANTAASTAAITAAIASLPHGNGGNGTGNDDDTGDGVFSCPIGSYPGFIKFYLDFDLDGKGWTWDETKVPSSQRAGVCETKEATKSAYGWTIEAEGKIYNFDVFGNPAPDNPDAWPLVCVPCPDPSAHDPYLNYTPKPGDKSFASAAAGTALTRYHGNGSGGNGSNGTYDYEAAMNGLYYSPGTGVSEDRSKWPVGKVPGVRVAGVALPFISRWVFEHTASWGVHNTGIANASIYDFPGDTGFTLYLPLSELSYIPISEIPAQLWA